MPIAGRPPYATDEPDSFYESAPAPQRRVLQQPPSNPNDRSSAYDVYSNYLTDNTENRQSGVGALGLGLMNMEDDDDDDDDASHHQKPSSSPSKHAALAAATAKPAKSPSPNVIAAPQPGYAAPIAALNLARPELVASTAGRAPANLQINTAQNPFADPHFPPSPSPPMVSNTPHPLQAPITPITPVFARPKPGIKFSETATPRPPKPIVRGNSEDTLLPTRGEKGDDFWRRFSMVAKEESRKAPHQKTSMWLSKTQSGSNRLSRWVWVVGILLLICIGGAIGIAEYVSHKSPSNQQPTAIGGSADEAATSSARSTVSVNANGSTVLHVSPTLTIDGRALDARATPIAPISALHKRRQHHNF